MAVRAVLAGTSNEVREPSLQKFLVEASLYKYVGLNFDDLRHRSHHEATDYIRIATMFAKDEADRAKEQARKSSR